MIDNHTIALLEKVKSEVLCRYNVFRRTHRASTIGLRL
jgi:hypothetical protein